MSITIKRQDGDIKFYGSQPEPIVTIYNGECNALLNYASIGDVKTAREVSDAVMIAGLFVKSILQLADGSDSFKTNNIEACYINEGDMSTEEALYSGRKILNWLESNKIVTVNKRERIRYKFTRFTFEKNRKLIIFYKPVVW